MKEPRQMMFLERRLYRRRRLIDAARLLPILGACLFLLPALMLSRDGQGASTAIRLVYFFFTWSALIMVAATIARALDRTPDNSTDPEGKT